MNDVFCMLWCFCILLESERKGERERERDRERDREKEILMVFVITSILHFQRHVSWSWSIDTWAWLATVEIIQDKTTQIISDGGYNWRETTLNKVVMLKHWFWIASVYNKQWMGSLLHYTLMLTYLNIHYIHTHNYNWFIT